MKDLSEVINLGDLGVFLCKMCSPRFYTTAAKTKLIEEIPNAQLFVNNGGEISPPGNTGSLSNSDLPDLIRQIVRETTDSIIETATAVAMKAAMEFVQDFMERKAKNNNQVAVGFPEAGKTEMGQRVLDQEKVYGYCDKLGVPRDSTVLTFREGWVKGKRTLKICFKDRYITERAEFLTNGRQLIHSDQDLAGLRFSPFIRPGLTQVERVRDYDLRQEVKRRRQAGETDIKINRARIVKAFGLRSSVNAVGPGDGRGTRS